VCSSDLKRLIDLSQAAAEKLGLIQQGIGEVVMEVFPGETDYISTR
jgi:rare lipoprotein A (peptidoglycan hydrolase)